MAKRKILIVDDLAQNRETRAKLLVRQGYEVIEAEDLEEAVRRFEEARPPVVVTDLRMPDGDGLAVTDRIKAIDPQTMVIIVTGNAGDTEAVIGAVRLDAFAYIQKGGGDMLEQLSEAIIQAFEKYEAELAYQRAAELEMKTKKDMLSFLTHTMRNTFAGAPAAVDQAILLSRDLSKELDNPRVYKAISNLAFLQTAFQRVDSMLDAYKVLVRDPENLVAAWQSDLEGEIPISDLLEDVQRAILGRLLFQDSQVLAFERLANKCKKSRKQLKTSFMSEVLLPGDNGSTTDWLIREFPIIEIHGEIPSIQLSREGVRFSLLYAVLTELLFNAVKYSDGREAVRVQWQDEEDHYVLICENTYDHISEKNKGSGKGLEFIEAVLQPLKALHLESSNKGPDDLGDAALGWRFSSRLELNKPF